MFSKQLTLLRSLVLDLLVEVGDYDVSSDMFAEVCHGLDNLSQSAGITWCARLCIVADSVIPARGMTAVTWNLSGKGLDP